MGDGKQYIAHIQRETTTTSFLSRTKKHSHHAVKPGVSTTTALGRGHAQDGVSLHCRRQLRHHICIHAAGTEYTRHHRRRKHQCRTPSRSSFEGSKTVKRPPPPTLATKHLAGLTKKRGGQKKRGDAGAGAKRNSKRNRNTEGWLVVVCKKTRQKNTTNILKNSSTRSPVVHTLHTSQPRHS